MPEPTFSPFMEDLWERLPQVYREEDEKNDWQFKKWLSGIASLGGDVRTLVERLIYEGPWEPDAPENSTSDLADGMTADEGWFDWLAMVRGIDIASSKTEGTVRPLLSTYAYNGGTKKAIRELVQANLSGTKFCKVYDHTDVTSAKGAADQWEILIVTKEDEVARGYVDDPQGDPDVIYLFSDLDPNDPDIAIVPDNPDPLDPDIVLIENSISDPVKVVNNAKAKPVGTILYHRNVEDFTDFNTWDATG